MVAVNRVKQALGWTAALSMALLGIYGVSLGVVPLIINRTLFVALSLILIHSRSYENDPDLRPDASPKLRIGSELVSWFFILGLLATIVYVVLENNRLADRISYLDPIKTVDYIFGLFMVVAVLDGTRRIAGWGLTSIAAFFVVYAGLGHRFPTWMSHRGLSLGDFVELQTLSAMGIYGVTLGAIVNFVFYFLLFAAFFELSGGGQLFINLAQFLFGRYRGGSAKTAVVASSLMGTINGSSVANVVGTGTFTIPMMKRAGYPGYFAGAVEAASSTGGQIMPPVMGAVAFVMAEMTGVDYTQLILHASIPAILYYVAIFLMVDLKAKKENIKGERFSRTEIKEALAQRAHQLLPLVVLLYFIFTGWSLMMAATAATVGVLVLSPIRKATRLSPMDLVRGLVKTGRSLPTVVMPCAAAGIIVGVVTTTGLGARVAGAMVALSGQNLALALILTAITCLIMGMGMPSVTSYILTAVFLAPALIKMGIPVIPAHLFVLYYAILSHVTPPVAVASYAAAGIAGAGSGRTGWNAVMLTSAGFIIPFVFVYNPALVLLGTTSEIIWVVMTTLIGICAFSGALVGIYFVPCRWYERAAGILGGVLLISPHKPTDFAGVAVLAVLLLIQWQRSQRERRTMATEVIGVQTVKG